VRPFPFSCKSAFSCKPQGSAATGGLTEAEIPTICRVGRLTKNWDSRGVVYETYVKPKRTGGFVDVDAVDVNRLHTPSWPHQHQFSSTECKRQDRTAGTTKPKKHGGFCQPENILCTSGRLRVGGSTNPPQPIPQPLAVVIRCSPQLGKRVRIRRRQSQGASPAMALGRRDRSSLGRWHKRSCRRCGS
jgi:hypothetical protein